MRNSKLAALAPKPWRVTVKMMREYSATITIRAKTQAAADRKALDAFHEWVYGDDFDHGQCDPLGLTAPWNEHDFIDHEPEIDRRFRCVDCGKDTSNSGEYYMVADKLWAAAGMAPHGGMLCLACLERRIRRPLTGEDFTAIFPDTNAWEQHVAARAGHATNHHQLSFFDVDDAGKSEPPAAAEPAPPCGGAAEPAPSAADDLRRRAAGATP